MRPAWEPRRDGSTVGIDPVKFLVVDALAGVRTFAQQLLQSHGHAPGNILCCADTDAALAQGLIFKPQFLLTDWFPKADLTGLQLFQRLREVQPTLHLALLSFDTTPAHEAESVAIGAHFLLKKPFTAEQFRMELNRTLEMLNKSAPGRGLTTKPATAARPALPLLAPQPVVKPGDRVRYQGAVHVAQHVVHRQGETVVQLQGQSGFVPLDKLQRA